MCACVHVLLCSCAVAQTVGKLRLLVDPGGDYAFVLDHKYRMQQREVELSTGPHHFTFWAPERSMLDTTINVQAGPVRDVMIRLPFSEEYRRYERELRESRKKNLIEMALPTAATLGAGYFAWRSYDKYRESHEQLVADEDLYRTSADPRTLSTLKETSIPNHEQEFKDRQTVFIIATSTFAVVAAGSVWMIRRAAKRPVPVFHDAEKVKFDGLVWMPYGEADGIWLAGIHLDLR